MPYLCATQNINKYKYPFGDAANPVLCHNSPGLIAVKNKPSFLFGNDKPGNS